MNVAFFRCLPNAWDNLKYYEQGCFINYRYPSIEPHIDQSSNPRVDQYLLLQVENQYAAEYVLLSSGARCQ